VEADLPDVVATKLTLLDDVRRSTGSHRVRCMCLERSPDADGNGVPDVLECPAAQAVNDRQRHENSQDSVAPVDSPWAFRPAAGCARAEGRALRN
jgi:hypothetical protein